MITLSTKDEVFLTQVHSDLARVIRRAAAQWDHTDKTFFITCSVRTLEQQKKLLAAGATKTMRSRHLPGATNHLSHAVDLAIKIDGELKWDWPLYADLATHIKAAAATEKVKIEWGGDWKTFRDGPHYQLPWDKYPG